MKRIHWWKWKYGIETADNALAVNGPMLGMLEIGIDRALYQTSADSTTKQGVRYWKDGIREGRERRRGRRGKGRRRRRGTQIGRGRKKGERRKKNNYYISGGLVMCNLDKNPETVALKLHGEIDIEKEWYILLPLSSSYSYSFIFSLFFPLLFLWLLISLKSSLTESERYSSEYFDSVAPTLVTYLRQSLAYAGK